MSEKKPPSTGKEALGPEVKGAVIGGLLVEAANYLTRAIFQHGANVVKEKVGKTFEDYRGELHAYLRVGPLTDKAKENFRRRWELRQLCKERTYEIDGKKKQYKKWDEIVFDRCLTKLWVANKDNPELRDKMFNYLGGGLEDNFGFGKKLESDKEFDLELEALNHDVVKQAVNRIKDDLREATTNPNGTINKLRNWANSLPGAKG